MTIQVKAVFQSAADAEAAQNKLRSLRVEQVTVEQIGGTTDTYQGFLNYNGDPAWYSLGNLSSMSMLSYSTSAMAGLYAAGANAFSEAARSFVLTATMPDDTYGQAKHAIELSGGSIQ
ncbi:hypothetical protein BVG16_10935 [Paenibacillus selenitireducens]|uniref:Uncharacterized protein n=1 Tax=Paenibacillus selenitireducens TaxID=1324314 RepID=A0A1T2XET2_9BACL|nr:hypothetical protein [Paenibacillus selenitireducens]OPA78389.1 hypothetical protein BVG16_10935 [Paenibacillus selenitireducens]